MRCGCNKNEMPVSISRETRYQLITLVPSTPAFSRVGTGVRLVYNHQFRTGTQELVATAIRLDEIGGNDHVGIAFKQRLTQAAVPFELRCGAGEHQFGIEVKLDL